MIILFTDFGGDDLYVGQVKARLTSLAPRVSVIDLLHRVPDFGIKAGAHLLAALAPQFPPESVFFAVIDPGVGGAREAVVVQAGTHWFVGPDNGLLSLVVQRAPSVHCWRIDWRPQEISASFHGRDLFAPIAAEIARGAFPESKLTRNAGLQHTLTDSDLSEIIYIDHYGNAFTGLRASNLSPQANVSVKGIQLLRARTFSDVPKGGIFCYENSVGLMEIAMNQGNAAESLDLAVGERVSVV